MDFSYTIQMMKNVRYLNSEKLTSIVEDGENFDGAISSLEKMDSYLN